MATRIQLADELLRRCAAAVRSSQLYSKGHPIIGRNLNALVAAMETLHALGPAIVIGLVGDELIVDDTPMPRTDAVGPLVRRLQQSGVERITVDRGVTPSEVAAFVEALATAESHQGQPASAAFPTLPHIRVGRVTVSEPGERTYQDVATIKQLYSDAVSAATTIWESAQQEGGPDMPAARTMIEGLAQAVSQNRTALLALTTLKNYDTYTFTHMVNVSILTMGQARGLGIDGSLLREFGLAALMHDIGKVRTPIEILNKTEALSDAEFEIMRRHTVDGAEILRETPEVPALAPVVAFEHHLRLDGTGYPRGVARTALNLGTMLCSIADVYDAMRSQRRYQQAFPTDRILAVLKRNDGQQFDQHLVRRFVQLIGIYPAGTLVRLDTGEVALVLKAHATDPYRPLVRVLVDREEKRVDFPYELSLWESPADEPLLQPGAPPPGSPGRPPWGRFALPSSVVAPLDPADYEIDPLALMAQS
jgi:putative nucleotidyltransferase with HDIG domain